MQTEGRKAFEIPPPPPAPPEDPKWSPPKKRKVWPWVLGVIVALAIIGSLVGDESTTSESERAASEDRIAEALGEEPVADEPLTEADTFRAMLAAEGLDYVFASASESQIDSMGFNGCEVIRKGVEGGLGFKASNGIVVLTIQESLAEYDLSLGEAQSIMVATIGAYCPELIDG